MPNTCWIGSPVVPKAITTRSVQPGSQSNKYSASANSGSNEGGNTLTPFGIMPTPNTATPRPARTAARRLAMLALSNRMDQRSPCSRRVRRIISREMLGEGNSRGNYIITCFNYCRPTDPYQFFAAQRVSWVVTGGAFCPNQVHTASGDTLEQVRAQTCFDVGQARANALYVASVPQQTA